MHDVVLNVNEGIPAYLSILHNDCGSPFSDDEFQLTGSHLNGLILDPDGLEISEERTTLRVSSSLLFIFDCVQVVDDDID